jgi:hypothetical protein
MGAPSSRRLARRTTKTRMETERGRLATKSYSRGIGSQRGSGEPTFVKRGREGGEEALKAHPPKGVSPRLTAEQKAQTPLLLARVSSGVSASRRCMDGEPGSRSDQTHLWSAFSPRSRWAADAGSRLESTEASGASQSKERRGHQKVVRRALAAQ